MLVRLGDVDTKEGAKGIPLKGKKTVYSVTIPMPSQGEEEHALPGK